MSNVYVIFGVLLCVFFGYQVMQGGQVVDLGGTMHSRPTGPGVYHK